MGNWLYSGGTSLVICNWGIGVSVGMEVTTLGVAGVAAGVGRQAVSSKKITIINGKRTFNRGSPNFNFLLDFGQVLSPGGRYPNLKALSNLLI